jgi:hypothetical protein
MIPWIPWASSVQLLWPLFVLLEPPQALELSTGVGEISTQQSLLEDFVLCLCGASGFSWCADKS